MAFCLSLNPRAEARVWSQDEGLDESSAMVWQCLCSQICAIKSQTDFSLSFLFLLFLAREKITSVSFFRRVEKKKRNTILLPKIAYRISKSDLFPDIAELMVVMGMCHLLKRKTFRSQACPSLHRTLENGRIRSKGVLNIIPFSPGSN